jgi:TRAP-type C4-dicarboxylate transport system permease small subunit
VTVPRRAFPAVERWLNGVGAAALAAMMLLVTANVVARYLFNRPILGTLEITEFLMVWAVYLSLSYTQFLKAHINIGLVTSLLPERRALACDLVTYLIGCAFFSLIVWQGTLMTLESYEMEEVTFGTIELLEWPVKMLVPFGSLVVSIRFLTDAVNTGKRLFGRGRH